MHPLDLLRVTPGGREDQHGRAVVTPPREADGLLHPVGEPPIGHLHGVLLGEMSSAVDAVTVPGGPAPGTRWPGALANWPHGVCRHERWGWSGGRCTSYDAGSPVHRFLNPKALGLALVGLVLMAVMVWLGMWQLGVYQDHQHRTAEAVLQRPPVPLADVLGPDAAFPSDGVSRPVIATGTYRADEQVYVRATCAVRRTSTPSPAPAGHRHRLGDHGRARVVRSRGRPAPGRPGDRAWPARAAGRARRATERPAHHVRAVDLEPRQRSDSGPVRRLPAAAEQQSGADPRADAGDPADPSSVALVGAPQPAVRLPGGGSSRASSPSCGGA